MNPVEIARTCLGVPYKHMGRTRSGMDCLGLMAYVAEEMGFTDIDDSVYGRVAKHDLLTQAVESQSFLKRVYTMEPGDILLMRFSKNPQHAAMFCGETIIHSYSNVGKVVEHRFADVWRKRVLAIYRWQL